MRTIAMRSGSAARMDAYRLLSTPTLNREVVPVKRPTLDTWAARLRPDLHSGA